MRRAPPIVALLSAALMMAGGAWADGISGVVEEDYARTHQESSDSATGIAEKTDSWRLTQRYRLSLDKNFLPSLRFSAGGAFEQFLGSSETQGLSTDGFGRTTNFYSSLTAGSQILSGIGGYTRRDVWLSQGQGRLVNEEPSLSLSWKPLDAPTFFLRLSRPVSYDTLRRSQDLSTPQALFSAQYAPIPSLDLRYSAGYSDQQDHLHLTDSTSVIQSGGANYGRRFEPWSSSIAAGLNLSVRRTLLDSSGGGGTFATQLFPLAGLSLVEVFPAVPALDTLAPNPALIDGSTVASAGINLGFAPALAGDLNPRDLGLQFVDTLTRVNTFYVWVVDTVGRPSPLTQDVAGTLQWSAFQSDDNLHWTQVDLAPLGAIFAPLQGRFEITLRAPISARYLKLVTRPLSPAATTDKNLVDIVVTELQAYLVTPITRSTGWQGSNSELFTFGGRTQLGGRPDLSYDFSLQLSRAGQSEAPSRETWLVSNGLNFSRQLQPVVLLSTRVARQDFDLGRGHEGAILYSASLAADELATLSHTLSYSGQINQAAAGTTTANSVSLFNRATPYRGIGLLAGGSWGTATNLSGQTSRSNVITLNATLEPHRALTLGGTYGRNGSVTLGGGLPTTVSRQQIIQGTVSFSPFPALYFSGGIQRTITELQGFTLVNLASGFSPFPGGALQFTLAFNETLDSNNAVTRLITPGLRWNITRSAVLSSSYGFVDSTGPQTNLHTRTFDVNLRIQL